MPMVDANITNAEEDYDGGKPFSEVYLLKLAIVIRMVLFSFFDFSNEAQPHYTLGGTCCTSKFIPVSCQ